MKHAKHETSAALDLFGPVKFQQDDAEKSATLFRDADFTELPPQHLGEHSRWFKPGVLAAVLQSGIILLSTDGSEPHLAIRRLGVQP